MNLFREIELAIIYGLQTYENLHSSEKCPFRDIKIIKLRLLSLQAFNKRAPVQEETKKNADAIVLALIRIGRKRMFAYFERLCPVKFRLAK